MPGVLQNFLIFFDNNSNNTIDTEYLLYAKQDILKCCR